jgi:hypothetical protein
MDDKTDKFLSAYRQEKNRLDKQRHDLSTTISQMLKGVDRITVIPALLADIFEMIEHQELTIQGGFGNQIMSWGIEHYISRKVNATIENISILWKYCMVSNHSTECPFYYNNDRTIAYFIPDKYNKVLYFSNSIVNFVCVIEPSRTDRLHIREVFDDLLDDEFANQYFHTLVINNSVDQLRGSLCQTNGLEIALTNLTNQHKQWSDCIDGNDYPSRISLKNMIAHNFDKSCRAFTYGDNRDCGYVLSTKSLTDRCEINDHPHASYIFDEILEGIRSIPNGYVDAQRRINTIDGIIND